MFLESMIQLWSHLFTQIEILILLGLYIHYCLIVTPKRHVNFIESTRKIPKAVSWVHPLKSITESQVLKLPKTEVNSLQFLYG